MPRRRISEQFRLLQRERHDPTAAAAALIIGLGRCGRSRGSSTFDDREARRDRTTKQWRESPHLGRQSHPSESARNRGDHRGVSRSAGNVRLRTQEIVPRSKILRGGRGNDRLEKRLGWFRRHRTERLTQGSALSRDDDYAHPNGRQGTTATDRSKEIPLQMTHDFSGAWT